MIVKLNIEKLLSNKTTQDKEYTLYQLSKDTGISYPTLHKMKNNDTSSISFLNIGLICRALNCTPNELILIEEI